MARQTITPQHSTKSNYDNVTIDSGLRADIMRCQMESKNTLTQNGSIYVGVGRADSSGIAYTKELRSGNQYQCLKVINADGDIGYGYLDWNNFNGGLNINNGSLNIAGVNGTMPILKIDNLGCLRVESTGICLLNVTQMNFYWTSANPYSGETIVFNHTTSGTMDGNTYSFGYKSFINEITHDTGYGWVLRNKYLNRDLIRFASHQSTGGGWGTSIEVSGSIQFMSTTQLFGDVNLCTDMYASYGDNPNISINNGTVTAGSFVNFSDQRLKENITKFVPSNSILNLPIYKYDFVKGSKNQIGCMAQDLQKICPDLVQEDKNGYLTIQENKIVFLLLEEVKKLRKEVNELKKEH